VARARQTKVGTKTPAKRDRIELIRERLLSQRQEILDLYTHDLRVGKEAADEASEDIVDRANNAYQREFMFNLSGGERRMLRQVEDALERLDQGEYGTCAHCREPIGSKRLKAIPWARYCVDCQEKEERGSLE
jgi:DnaK suppressor protein